MKHKCKTLPERAIIIGEAFAVMFLVCQVSQRVWSPSQRRLSHALVTLCFLMCQWPLQGCSPSLVPMHAVSHILPAHSYFQSLLHLLSEPVVSPADLRTQLTGLLWTFSAMEPSTAQDRLGAFTHLDSAKPCSLMSSGDTGALTTCMQMVLLYGQVNMSCHAAEHKH